MLNKSQQHTDTDDSAKSKRINSFSREHKFDYEDDGGDDDDSGNMLDASGASDIERFLDTDWQLAKTNAELDLNISGLSNISSTTPRHHEASIDASLNDFNSNECTRVRKSYCLFIPIIFYLLYNHCKCIF